MSRREALSRWAADSGRRVVEVAHLTLEPDTPRLPLSRSQKLAQALELEPHQRRRGWVIEPGHAVGPAYIHQIALDRRGRPPLQRIARILFDPDRARR
jgi:mannose/cellobiose epimerase-like protein (N-acyl-D-glucosamine 2-epimerase family)